MDRQHAEECFREVVDLMALIDLPFFLTCGTALGAYRDSGFTPTEKDIDFGCLSEDFVPKADRLATELAKLDYDVRKIERPFGVCWIIIAKKQTVKIDFGSYPLWKDKRFICSNLKDYALVYNREQLETTELVDVFGRTVRVPSPIRQYLELEYGPDWQTPREDHISRTRVTGFMKKEEVPHGLLNPFAELAKRAP